jgi:hypothetical protein
MEFIDEDDLLSFEGWLRFQAVDPATMTPEELGMWRSLFDEVTQRHEASPKVGLMKLRRVPGEQKYAVAIQKGADLWLTLWVKCSPKGEVFVMLPRGDRDWDPHYSYHADGRCHNKSYGSRIPISQKRQPLTTTFCGIEHLCNFVGHGANSIGAVCDPDAFDGLVVVEPGVLGPVQGSVGVDLLEPGYEPKHDADAPPSRVFQRGDRPSVMITIRRDAQQLWFPRWPADFRKVADNL